MGDPNRAAVHPVEILRGVRTRLQRDLAEMRSPVDTYRAVEADLDKVAAALAPYRTVDPLIGEIFDTGRAIMDSYHHMGHVMIELEERYKDARLPSPADTPALSQSVAPAGGGGVSAEGSPDAGGTGPGGGLDDSDE